MPDDLSINYTGDELIEKLRFDAGYAERLWQAFGFARMPGGGDGGIGGTFSDQDLASLAVFAGSDREMDPAAQLAAARSIGQATARLAEWQAEQIRVLVADPRTTQTEAELADAVGHLQQFVWRRHLEGFLARQEAADGGDEVIVGFADIVGYTSLSRRLRLAALESLLETFESAAHLLVTRNDGSVIKSIGDAVMFTAPSHGAAATIAVELHALTSDGELPTLRIGIASGRALIRMGDVFGEPVNIAARLASSAREGTTLVDDSLASALDDDPEFHLNHISSLSVRGYRRLKAHALTRSRTAPSVVEAAAAAAAEAEAVAAQAAADKLAARAAKKAEKAEKARLRAERKAAKHSD